MLAFFGCFLMLMTYLLRCYECRFAFFLSAYEPRWLYRFFEEFTGFSDTFLLGRYLYLQNYRTMGGLGNIFLFRYLPLGILWFLTYRLIRQKKTSSVFLRIICCHALSTLSLVLLKIVFSRSRPFLFVNQSICSFYFPGGGGDSFPSGHTADYWALFLPIAECYPKYRFLWLFIPCMIAIGRFALLMHYPSDVLVSLYLVKLADFFSKIVLFREEKSHLQKNKS